jgi:phosphoribosylformylglycinamidine synthase
LLRALHDAIRAGLVRACHDLSEGGLAVAAAEMAFAGEVGVAIEMEALRESLGELPPGYDRDATALFSESCTRFLVEVSPRDSERFEAAFARLGALPPVRIGRTTAAQRLEIRAADGSMRISLPLEELRKAHQGSFQG